MAKSAKEAEQKKQSATRNLNDSSEISLWKLPEDFFRSNPDMYLREVVEIYARCYNLTAYGRDMLLRAAQRAYREAGVFGSKYAVTSYEDIMAASAKVNTGIIAKYVLEEDKEAKAFLSRLEDRKPLSEYIRKTAALKEEIGKGFLTEGGTQLPPETEGFSFVKCPFCGAPASVKAQGISPLETGTLYGGIIVELECAKSCGGSPAVYMVATDDSGSVFGSLNKGSAGSHS